MALEAPLRLPRVSVPPPPPSPWAVTGPCLSEPSLLLTHLKGRTEQDLFFCGSDVFKLIISFLCTCADLSVTSLSFEVKEGYRGELRKPPRLGTRRSADRALPAWPLTNPSLGSRGPVSTRPPGGGAGRPWARAEDGGVGGGVVNLSRRRTDYRPFLIRNGRKKKKKTPSWHSGDKTVKDKEAERS